MSINSPPLTETPENSAELVQKRATIRTAFHNLNETPPAQTHTELLSSLDFDGLREYKISQLVPENLRYTIKEDEIPITPISNPYTSRQPFGPIEVYMSREDFQLYKNTMLDADLYKEAFKAVSEKLKEISEQPDRTPDGKSFRNLKEVEKQLINELYPKISDYAEGSGKGFSDIGVADMIKYAFSGFSLAYKKGDALYLESPNFRPFFAAAPGDGNLGKILDVIEHYAIQKNPKIAKRYEPKKPEKGIWAWIKRHPAITALGVIGLSLAAIGAKVYADTQHKKYLQSDEDNDGMTVEEEQERGTDPKNPDTDADNIPDGVEVYEVKTDPLNPDTDADEIGDDVDPHPLEPLEKELVEFVNDYLPEELREKYIEAAISDRSFNQRDTDNIKFLKWLYENNRAAYQGLIDNVKILTYDQDGDGMSSYFEEFVADLPWDVANERYVIYVNSHPQNTDEHLTPYEPIEENGIYWNEIRYILKVNKFKPENVIAILGNNATKENFEKAVSDVAERVNENAIVFVQLVGHGVPGRFWFNDGKGNDDRWEASIPYEETDKMIDKIVGKYMVVGIGSCFADTPETLSPIEKGPSPRTIIAGQDILDHSRIAHGLWKKRLQEFVDKMDSDKNGYISVQETSEYKSKSLGNFGEIRDLDNIASKIYFGDATVDEYKGKDS